MAYFNQRDYTAALADFDLALQFLPNHSEARLFRAQTHQQMGHTRRGISDLDYLLQQPNPAVKVYFIRSRMLRLVGDKDAAFADEVEGMKHTPTDEASWVERGLSRMTLNPEAALEDFRKAEALNPHSFPALHNQAFVLNEHLNRPADAIKVLDRVLGFYPDYAVSLVDRAVLLARQGSVEAALRDVKRVEQLDRRPSALYQMATVYAILAKHDASHQKMAMRLLVQAFRQGHPLDNLDNTPDFNSLQQASGYDALRFAVRTLATTENE
jgi:tetratricopeptide (TPR) repeat protein